MTRRDALTLYLRQLRRRGQAEVEAFCLASKEDQDQALQAWLTRQVAQVDEALAAIQAEPPAPALDSPEEIRAAWIREQAQDVTGAVRLAALLSGDALDLDTWAEDRRTKLQARAEANARRVEDLQAIRDSLARGLEP
jgi:hypothetical protein